jgi:hypothetical protein
MAHLRKEYITFYTRKTKDNYFQDGVDYERLAKRTIRWPLSGMKQFPNGGPQACLATDPVYLRNYIQQFHWRDRELGVLFVTGSSTSKPDDGMYELQSIVSIQKDMDRYEFYNLVNAGIPGFPPPLPLAPPPLMDLQQLPAPRKRPAAAAELDDIPPPAYSERGTGRFDHLIHKKPRFDFDPPSYEEARATPSLSSSSSDWIPPPMPSSSSSSSSSSGWVTNSSSSSSSSVKQAVGFPVTFRCWYLAKGELKSLERMVVYDSARSFIQDRLNSGTKTFAHAINHAFYDVNYGGGECYVDRLELLSVSKPDVLEQYSKMNDFKSTPPGFLSAPVLRSNSSSTIAQPISSSSSSSQWSASEQTKQSQHVLLLMYSNKWIECREFMKQNFDKFTEAQLRSLFETLGSLEQKVPLGRIREHYTDLWIFLGDKLTTERLNLNGARPMTDEEFDPHGNSGFSDEEGN